MNPQKAKPEFGADLKEIGRNLNGIGSQTEKWMVEDDVVEMLSIKPRKASTMKNRHVWNRMRGGKSVNVKVGGKCLL